MSCLSLLALSKVTSALLCAMLSRGWEKVGLLHSGEMGTKAAHARVCSCNPCFGCLPLSLVAAAGLGISCDPERVDVRSAMVLGAQPLSGCAPC